MARKHNKKRLPRGASGYSQSGKSYDLDVPLVLAKDSTGMISYKRNNSKKSIPSKWRGSDKEQFALIERLQNTGYSTIALSHEINGNFTDDDHADTTIKIPNKNRNSTIANGDDSMESKKRKLNENPIRAEILKRLNVIIEQESDLANFTTSLPTNSKEVLQSYDLIAISPRSETVLCAVCNSKNMFYSDIITLDYTAGRGGVQLPYRLKPTYIAAATSRGIAFELPYGPALIDPSKRKAFVQAARQLLTASMGVKKPLPRIIVSSGGRELDGRDHGAMVLRSPGDILNFCKVVLGFEDSVSRRVMSSDAQLVVQRGKNRKSSACIPVDAGEGVIFQLASENDVVEPTNEREQLDAESIFEKETSNKVVNLREKRIKGEESNSDKEDGFLLL
uniref:Uncharacterized protein n=1 Tax=Chaetoceros debilis TaxID=122233 RepID=A0A7S3QJM5_9STRA|mmetsp:Transcript_12254/g.17850  ORF Transcript_12254/g.17850 Transcript_12254/m.17850 type:complete len:392 (+) Transcript_12254:154-1329(+)|eukprot:CAMPEP_0194079080 /NCGR_PEP_ID=MMETSP0149-20130528/5312_1 /TAXON_ID=122233 /ORGANISM="Chaetoceros debilis, Strain MM31A-1" /LENGTH=391 /DNA_ID=CAMNT_0038760451 /DNA_START=45 /DNA_END=1220 /DNA_ORIENTATION=+